MRKVLSLVLILSLVLGSFGFAFAAPSDGMLSDVAGTDYDEAVTVLYALDVVSGYENTGLYQPEQVVTRAEMAVLIIRQLGLAGNAEGNTSSFPDMDGYGWAEGYIGYAQQLKIIAGYPDGTFKPGNTVTYDEALTMIVSAIGYTQAAREMQGEWPAVYVAKARQLDITDNVTASGSAGAKRGDIAIYLYNALTCTTGYVDGNGNFKPNTNKDLEEILMINNLGAEQSRNYEVIEGDEDALINIKPYVGQSAKTIYMTKGKYEDYIIAISDIRSEEITGIYDADDETLTGVDGVEYKLSSVMDDTKSNKATSGPVQFVNGIRGDIEVGNSNDKILATATSLDKSFNKEVQLTMHVDKSSRTVNGIYSIMFWKANQSEVVDADDLKDIDDRQKLLGKDFTLTDDDEIDTNSFQLYGVDSLDDIKAGHVVYVYADSKDNEITRIDVGTETVEGEATRVNNDGDKVTISGTVYEYADEKLTHNGVKGEIGKNDIDAGDEVALVLDAYGYIFDRDYISSAADNYAVVLGAGPRSSSSDAYEMRLMLADGSEKTFDLVDKLTDDSIVTGVTNSDGTPLTDPDTGYDRVNGSRVDALVGQIIKYSVDRNGRISDFEEFNMKDSVNPVQSTVTQSSSLGYNLVDTDNNTGSTKKEYSVTKAGSYNGFSIADNAVIWTYDGKRKAAGRASDYSTTTKAKVLDSDDAVGQYVIDKKGKIAAIVLYEFSSGDDVFGIATDRGRRTSTNQDYEIEFWIGKTQDFYPASNTAYNRVAGLLSASDFYNRAGGTQHADGPLLYIKQDAEGDVTNVQTAESRDKVQRYAFRIDAADATSYSSNRLEIIDFSKLTPAVGTTLENSFFINSDAIVYYNDGNTDYQTGNIRDLSDLGPNDAVWLYSTDDDSENIDYVVVITAR